MYPDGFATNVIVTDVSTPLEGEMRPHFFGGVATVVTKLLLQALPDAAFFGEKDYQQLLVIKRARDLDIRSRSSAAPRCANTTAWRCFAQRVLSAPRAPRRRTSQPRLHEAIKAVHTASDRRRGSGSIAPSRRGFTSVDYVAIRDAGVLRRVC